MTTHDEKLGAAMQALTESVGQLHHALTDHKPHVSGPHSTTSGPLPLVGGPVAPPGGLVSGLHGGSGSTGKADASTSASAPKPIVGGPAAPPTGTSPELLGAVKELNTAVQKLTAVMLDKKGH